MTGNGAERVAELNQELLQRIKSDYEYALTDQYLGSLMQAEIPELTTHLRDQTRLLRAFRPTDGGSGGVKKSVAFIRFLIEEQGGDPDELLKSP